MVKKLLLVAALCLSIEAAAQTPAEPTQRISFSFGGAVPVGNFRNRNFEAAYPPFAKGGSMLTAGYARTIKQHLALGASAGWRSNAFKLDAFVNTDDELVHSKETKPWQSAFVLTDIYLQSGGYDDVRFYAKGSVGAAFNRSAYLQILTEYGSIERPSDNAVSLAWSVGGGMQLQVQRFGVDLQVSLLSTKPTFEIKDKNEGITRYKQPMNSLNLSAGLFYTL